MKRSIIAGAALAVISLLPFVSDLAAQPAGSASSWTGPYFGVNIGVSQQNTDTTNTVVPNSFFSGLFALGIRDGALPRGSSHDSYNGIVGAALGYNFQRGSFVYGVEVDGTWLGHFDGFSVTTQVTSQAGIFPLMETRTEARTDWLATFRVRAGLLVTPETLVFATMGLAAGGVEGATSITPARCNLNAFCATGSRSDTRWGWTAGAGVERMVAAGWAIKLEYLYYDLGSFSYTANEISAGFPLQQGVPTLAIEHDVAGHLVRLGVRYGF